MTEETDIYAGIHSLTERSYADIDQSCEVRDLPMYGRQTQAAQTIGMRALHMPMCVAPDHLLFRHVNYFEQEHEQEHERNCDYVIREHSLASALQSLKA